MSFYKKYKQQNAIIRIAIFTYLIKAIALTQYYLTDDSVGDIALSLTNSLIYNFIFSGMIFGILLFLWHLLTPIQELFNFTAFLFTFITIIISMMDLFLIRFAGMRFSPSIIKTYGIDYISSPDVLLTLFDNPVLSLVTILILIGIILMFIFYKKIMSNKEIIFYQTKKITFITTLFTVMWLLISNINSSYYLSARPAEITFLKISSYTGKTALKFNKATKYKSNRMIETYFGKKIIDEEYPLLNINKSDTSKTTNEYPDIFFIMIESLRGLELSYLNKIDPANTPTIDSLSKSGVTFIKFTSNGYPTDDGMFSAHTSILPHYNRKNIRDNVNTKYNSIPNILHNIGYKTGMISAVKPFKPMIAWYQKWYEDFSYKCGGSHCNEYELFQKSKEWVLKQDSIQHNKPLFYYSHTNDLHYPYYTRFSIKSDSTGNKYYSEDVPEKIEDLRSRYKKTLETTDFALGKFLYFLSQRKNKDNTLIIFFGDHGKEAGEVFKRGTRLYPMNAMMLSGAIISGPKKLIGTSRIEDFPVSGVDILPTLVNVLNLDIVYASWGNNMLENKGNKNSINIRPGGLRYNWGDSSLYINSYNPNDYWVSTFFNSPNDKTSFQSSVLNQKARDIYNLVQYGSYLIEEDKLIK